MIRRLPVWKVYERGIICRWKVYERGIFPAKNGIQEGKGSDLGAEASLVKFILVPPPWTELVQIPGWSLNTLKVQYWHFLNLNILKLKIYKGSLERQQSGLINSVTKAQTIFIL